MTIVDGTSGIAATPLEQNEEHEKGTLAHRLVQKLAGESPAKHRHTEEVVSSGAHGVIMQVFDAIAATEGMAVIDHLVSSQAGVIAKQAVTPEGLFASRRSAEEAFAGTYDAVEKKWAEYQKTLPVSMNLLTTGATAFAAALAFGILLAVWRFVLFGLGPATF